MHFQGSFCVILYFLAAYSANLPVIPCLYKSIYRHIFRANLRIVSKSTESRARGTIISCSSPITFNKVQFTVKFWQKHTNVTRIFDRLVNRHPIPQCACFCIDKIKFTSNKSASPILRHFLVFGFSFRWSRHSETIENECSWKLHAFIG